MEISALTRMSPSESPILAGVDSLINKDKGDTFSAKEELIELIRKRSYDKADKPIYTLASGKKSNFYFNLKKTTFSPKGQVLIGFLIFEKIQELGLKPKGIGGLTMGADPIAAAVSYTSYLRKNPIEAFAVRKEQKKHGKGLQIEGDVKRGDKVIIIDDVITTGASTIKAIEISRENGLDILAVIVLVDRCEENGKENIEALGVKVYPVLTVQDFL